MYRKEIRHTLILCICWVIVVVCPVYLGAVEGQSDSTKKSSDSTGRALPDTSKLKSALPVTTQKPQKEKATNPGEAFAVKNSAQKNSETGYSRFSIVLLRIAERVPKILEKPVNVLKPLVAFARQNGTKVIILAISLVVIFAALLFFMQHIERSRFLTTTRLSVMDKEVQRTCRYIENNYFDPELTVDSICTVMVTGKSFLTALFEKELGMSVEDFIMQVRINRAKIMLHKDSNLDDEYITIKTGFFEPEDLRKAFSTMCGVDIEEFRKSLNVETGVVA